jgi:catechol 2,3-dioxygenase-like lactoylglutathione lyase family enzyme
MAQLSAVAPVLPVRDVDEALHLYERLGFAVRRYAGGAAYGYAHRGGVDLHLSEVSSLDPLSSLVSVFLYVDSADSLHEEWRAAQVPGRLHPPQDTDYGLREGAYVDPDGNLLRFGSPLPASGTA